MGRKKGSTNNSNKIEYKDLSNDKKEAYLKEKRAEALKKEIDKADYSVSTVTTKKIYLTSGVFKENYAVGETIEEAKQNLYKDLYKKWCDKYELKDFEPESDTIKLDPSKLTFDEEEEQSK